MANDNEQHLRRYNEVPRPEGWPPHKSPGVDLVARLVELKAKTSPRHGSGSAIGKDLAAFEALQLAGQLVDELVGWAIDHQIGLAMEGRSFVPLQPSGTRQHPEYVAARQEVDDHRHEMNGAALRSNSKLNIDPRIARQILINLLKPNPGDFPESLRVMLLSAINELDYGETHPILRASKSSRKVSYREQQLQLKAIGFIYYKTSQGKKKYVAQREVADAYGVGEEAIKQWEKRLRDELGALPVSRVISFAQNAASLEAEALRKMCAGDSTATLGRWEDEYGALALQKAASEFKAAQRGMVD